MLEALFFPRQCWEQQQQLLFDLEMPEVESLHRRWERDAERDRINCTRFAQRALKPEEVQRELEATDAVRGDPTAVREFVLVASQRVGLSVTKDSRPGVFRVAVSPECLATVPEPVGFALPAKKNGYWLISFRLPTPEGAEYLGRNHRFVAALARFLFEDALPRRGQATASRCGVLRTRAVAELTTILLLRVRYLIEQPQTHPLLSEEVLVVGYQGNGERDSSWLDCSEALRLLAEAKPDTNIPMPEKRELIQHTLTALGNWDTSEAAWGQENPIHRAVRDRVGQRANELAEAHKRIRQSVDLKVRGLRVKPQFPPHLLGILGLQPVVEV